MKNLLFSLMMDRPQPEQKIESDSPVGGGGIDCISECRGYPNWQDCDSTCRWANRTRNPQVASLV